MPRSIWNLFKRDVDDYQGGIADQGSEVDAPAIAHEVVSEVYIPLGAKRGRPEDEWWDLDGAGDPSKVKEPWMSDEDKIKIGGMFLLVFLVMFILMGASFYAFILSLFFTAVYYSLFLQASVPDSDDNRREWGPSSLVGYSVGFVAVFVGLLAMGVRPVDSFPYATFVVLMAYVADSFGWVPHRWWGT